MLSTSSVYLIGKDLYAKKVEELTPEEAALVHERFSDKMYQLFIRITPYSIFDQSNPNYQYRINTEGFVNTYNQFRFIYTQLNARIPQIQRTYGSINNSSTYRYQGSSSWQVHGNSNIVGEVLFDLYFGSPSNNGIFGYYMHNQGFSAGFHGEKPDTFMLLFNSNYRHGHAQGQLWSLTFDAARGTFHLAEKAGGAIIDAHMQVGSIVFDAGKDGVQFLGKALPKVAGHAADFIGNLGDVATGIIDKALGKCDVCVNCGAHICDCLKNTAAKSVHNIGSATMDGAEKLIHGVGNIAGKAVDVTGDVACGVCGKIGDGCACIGNGIGEVICLPFKLCGAIIKGCEECCKGCDEKLCGGMCFAGSGAGTVITPVFDGGDDGSGSGSDEALNTLAEMIAAEGAKHGGLYATGILLAKVIYGLTMGVSAALRLAGLVRNICCRDLDKKTQQSNVKQLCAGIALGGFLGALGLVGPALVISGLYHPATATVCATGGLRFGPDLYLHYTDKSAKMALTTEYSKHIGSIPVEHLLNSGSIKSLAWKISGNATAQTYVNIANAVKALSDLIPFTEKMANQDLGLCKSVSGKLMSVFYFWNPCKNVRTSALEKLAKACEKALDQLQLGNLVSEEFFETVAEVKNQTPGNTKLHTCLDQYVSMINRVADSLNRRPVEASAPFIDDNNSGQPPVYQGTGNYAHMN